MENVNVFGEPLITCSNDPLTGYFRDGCCNTEPSNIGLHTVCVVTTEEFLLFSSKAGNDLSTPRPEWNFPGLRPGDKWCLCAVRFLEAYKAGFAPKVVLEATNEKTLEIVEMNVLVENAFYASEKA